MKVMITKTDGSVAFMLPASGPDPGVTPALVMRAEAVGLPYVALTELKLFTKSVWLPKTSTMKARNVPAEAMIQKAFCQRKVVRRPATRMAPIRTTMTMAPTKTQWVSVWKLLPQSIRVWLLKVMPRVARIGPSA